MSEHPVRAAGRYRPVLNRPNEVAMKHAFVSGGVCAPKGFRASGVHCGIRKNRDKRDLALIVSDVPCTCAALFTSNLVKGAPIEVSRAHLWNSRAQAIIANSGNANTCNADGLEVADAMCRLVESYTGIIEDDVLVASTGVIGQPLSIDPIRTGMQDLVDHLGYDQSLQANEAIMTTDTKPKEVAVSFTLGGKTCTIGGIAKGSGMIHPNLATMLVFLTSDAAISTTLLDKALRDDVADTFNMVSVDGDTSTNDTLFLLANGLCGNAMIEEENEDYRTFCAALRMLTQELCRRIAADGEGATRLLLVNVTGAKTKDDARRAAKSVACSSLTKAAIFGADANWGRVLCAIGYSGADVDITGVDVDFVSAAGKIAVCRDGAGVNFSEDKAKRILLESEITVDIRLRDGKESATAYGCDLTYDYVRINGDYRT